MSTLELRKAAVLLMSLPQEQAGALLSKLDAKQVETVSIEIAKLNAISGEEQHAVIVEFADIDPKNLGGGSGGMDTAKSLIEKARRQECQRHDRHGPPIDRSRSVRLSAECRHAEPADLHHRRASADDRADPLASAAGAGAEIIAGLPSDRQLAVIRRVATMGQTNPEIIQEVERGLESRMSSVMSQQFEKAGGVPTVAEILNVTDRATERSLLENLAQEDPDLVEEIRRLMFVFEDINKFANKDVQTVLKNVETSQWAMALKGASEELKGKVLGNMSQRAADMLREEMEYLGPVRLSNVEQVQQQIVDVVRRLEDSGEISMQAAEEKEEFIS